MKIFKKFASWFARKERPRMTLGLPAPAAPTTAPHGALQSAGYAADFLARDEANLQRTHEIAARAYGHQYRPPTDEPAHNDEDKSRLILAQVSSEAWTERSRADDRRDALGIPAPMPLQPTSVNEMLSIAQSRIDEKQREIDKLQGSLEKVRAMFAQFNVRADETGPALDIVIRNQLSRIIHLEQVAKSNMHHVQQATDIKNMLDRARIPSEKKMRRYNGRRLHPTVTAIYNYSLPERVDLLIKKKKKPRRR